MHAMMIWRLGVSGRRAARREYTLRSVVEQDLGYEMLQIYVNLPNSDYGKLVGRKVDVHSLPILNFMQGNQIYPKVGYDEEGS